MSRRDEYLSCLAEVPLVAVLRGLAPERAPGVAQALVRGGVRVMEVTLNSVGALECIRLVRNAVPENVAVGAGTVLRPEDVYAARDAGASFAVMPNLSESVMSAGRACGLGLMPGVFTPTEAFRALENGADVLKLFPAEVFGPSGLKALRAVLPSPVGKIYPVGGVDVETMPLWIEAGADGFGVGGSLFSPKFTDAEIEIRANKLVSACKKLMRKAP